MIRQDIIRHLNRATVRRGFRAPVPHHVVIRVEWRGNAGGSAFNRPDTKDDGIPGNNAGGIADGFAHNRAGVIRAGVAVIRAGAADEQHAGK